MFERYTERARRVIFFARYEASLLGSPSIETEHFLLGLLREDKDLANRFLGNADSVEGIRQEIRSRVEIRPRISTSIDLPLSAECKRILVHAGREAEKMGHRFVATGHLLLGILTDESMAGRLLLERGLRLDAVREELRRKIGDLEPPLIPTSSDSESSQSPSLVLRIGKLMACLAKHGFEGPQQHFSKVCVAQSTREVEIARAELDLFMESLVEDLRKRNVGDDVLAPPFEGFDWQLSLKSLRSHLPDKADWTFRFWFTVLIAELLLDRYEQHT